MLIDAGKILQIEMKAVCTSKTDAVTRRNVGSGIENEYSEELLDMGE